MTRLNLWPLRSLSGAYRTTIAAYDDRPCDYALDEPRDDEDTTTMQRHQENS